MSDIGQREWAREQRRLELVQARAEGAAEATRKIGAWLRGFWKGDSPRDLLIRGAFHRAADAIEAGEHEPKETR